MKLYEARRIIRDRKSDIAKKANEHLHQFGLMMDLVITNHVADRIFDRSLRVDVDIDKIMVMLQEMVDFHLGRLMHKAFFAEDGGLILYRLYRGNLVECFALAIECKMVDNGVFQVIVRTFMPAASLTYVRQRDNLLFAPKRKMRLVSNLQKMLYSSHCPEALKILR